jgi:hypothetical protein
MVWAWLIFVFSAIGIGIATGTGHMRSGKVGGNKPPARLPEPTPSELEQIDQLEALRRYGTSEDAARLRDIGIDLGALGHRQPPDN